MLPVPHGPDQQKLAAPTDLRNGAPPSIMLDNAYIESFNGRLRDACLNVDWYLLLTDARGNVESWQRHDNRSRPYNALGWLKPQELALAVVQQAGERDPEAYLSADLNLGNTQ